MACGLSDYEQYMKTWATMNDSDTYKNELQFLRAQIYNACVCVYIYIYIYIYIIVVVFLYSFHIFAFYALITFCVSMSFSIRL